MKKIMKRKEGVRRLFSAGKRPSPFLRILFSFCLIASLAISAAGCGSAAGDGSADVSSDPDREVTAAQMRNWFGPAIRKDMPDDKVESLADQTLIVIGESRTEEGVTVTLNAAMRDDQRIFMSFTVEGEKELQPDIGPLDKSGSWMESPLAKELLKSQMPDLSEQEIEAYLTEMKERRESGDSWGNTGLSLTAFRAEDGSQGILAQQDWPSGTSDKIMIHMEKFGGIEVPFEFEADIPVKGEPVEYTGDISFTAAGGQELTLTKVRIYPMSGISAEMYGKDVSLESLEADDEFYKSAEISAVLWNGTEVRGRGSGRQSEEERMVVFMRDFQEQAITPEDVTKIQIGDEWFELSRMTKAAS